MGVVLVLVLVVLVQGWWAGCTHELVSDFLAPCSELDGVCELTEARGGPCEVEINLMWVEPIS